VAPLLLAMHLSELDDHLKQLAGAEVLT